ncbi:MAG: hypothetical protein LBR22_00810 [Desulfovibrio sp.]|jgi:hypothetical protein|nr:hypothetical protein [Desulfovibrio sp.]
MKQQAESSTFIQQAQSSDESLLGDVHSMGKIASGYTNLPFDILIVGGKTENAVDRHLYILKDGKRLGGVPYYFEKRNPAFDKLLTVDELVCLEKFINAKRDLLDLYWSAPETYAMEAWPSKFLD